MPVDSLRDIHGMQFCWLCGGTGREKDWFGPWWLQEAHIASGGGRARRVEDVRAVILLCPRCHMLHVSDSDKHPTTNINGRDLPTIDERHTLWIKEKMDHENFSMKFLEGIWIGSLPTPLRPPEYWMKELKKNQGLIL